MKHSALFSRANLSFVLVICLGVTANLAYEYKNYSQANPDTIEGSATPQRSIDMLAVSVTAPTLTIAGFPGRFYLSSDVPGTPPVKTLTILAASLNIVFWSILAGGALFYERMMQHRAAKEPSASTRRRIGLTDLLLAISMAAIVFSYWSYLERVTAKHKDFANTIKSAGGTVKYTVLLPKFYGEHLPEWFRTRYARVSSMRIENPNAKLVEQIVEQSSLQELRMSGGDYPEQLVDRLSRNPLLWHLRLAGRKLTPQNVASLGSLSQQLIILNLMRTNITATGIQALGEMPRLAELTLTHTDIRLQDLGRPAWSKHVKYLGLPHPTAGQSDSLALEGWPTLEILEISEWDTRKNDATLSVSLRNLPMLHDVQLDPLQKFDLQLHNLPALQTVRERWLQPMSRVARKEDIPGAVWLGSLELSDLPAFKAVTVWGSELQGLSIKNAPGLELTLTDLHYEQDVADLHNAIFDFDDGRIKTPIANSNLSVKQGWIEALAKCTGPGRVNFSGLDLRGVDLSPLKQNAGMESLDLSETQMSGELRGLAGNSAIRKLQLRGLPMDGRQIAWLVEELPALTHLECDRHRFDDLRLEDNSRLHQMFAATDTLLSNTQVLRLKNLPNLKETVDLPATPITHCNVRNAPALVGFSFRSPLPESSQLSGFRDLKYFAGGGLIVDDRLVSELAACRQLKHLSLAYASASAESLKTLGELPQLETLSLTGCKVDDAVLMGLAQNSKLKALVLDNTSITPQSLAKFQNMKSLRRLSFNYTQAATGDLTGLSALENLEELGIAGGRLTPALAFALSKLKLLESVDLSGGKMTPKGIGQLRKTRPPSLRLLVLRNIEAPKLSILGLIPVATQLDITDSYFEPNSMDQIVASNRSIDTQAGTNNMASMQFLGMATVYDRRLKPLKSWEIFPAAFDPQAPRVDASQIGFGGYGSMRGRVIRNGRVSSLGVVREDGSNLFSGANNAAGATTAGQDLDSDKPFLARLAERLGYALGAFWSSGTTPVEY